MKCPAVYQVPFLAFFILVPALVFAQYPVGKKNNVVVPEFSYYTQRDHFDGDGNVIRGLPGGSFDTFIFNIYYGYGITNRLDFVLDVPYLFEVSNSGKGNVLTNHGMGDMLLGLNYNLVQFKKNKFLSIQLLNIIPLYTNTNAATTLGLDEYGSELKISYYGALTAKTYFTTAIAYRKYYNDRGPDQLSLSAGMSYSINHQNQLGFDLSFLRSVSHSGRISLNSTFVNGIYVERDYGYLKPGLNYTHQFSSKLSVSTSTYYVPYGHNTGVVYSSKVSGSFKF